MKRKKLWAIGIIVLIGGISVAMGVNYYNAEKTLTDYEEVIENGEKHVVFYEDGDRILTFSFMYHDEYIIREEGCSGMIPLKLAVWHRGGTHIDSMRIEIQLPKPALEHPGIVYLRTPEGIPSPPIHFQRSVKDHFVDFDSTLDIPDMGVQREGTVTFDFLVKPLWEVKNKTNFTVDVETKLSETGVFWKKYAARCQTEIEI